MNSLKYLQIIGTLAVSMLLAVLAGTGLTQSVRAEDLSSKSSVSEQQKQALLEKAQTLAEKELRKLAAAEMLYRNELYFHTQMLPSLGTRSSAYTKIYRHFTRYEIQDIVVTPSLLRPLEFTIRYEFDMMGTKPIPTQRQNAQDARSAWNDFNFSPMQSDAVIRTYECDESGEPIEIPSPFLERPNYWQVLGDNPLAEFFIEPAIQPPPK